MPQILYSTRWIPFLVWTLDNISGLISVVPWLSRWEVIKKMSGNIFLSWGGPKKIWGKEQLLRSSAFLRLFSFFRSFSFLKSTSFSRSSSYLRSSSFFRSSSFWGRLLFWGHLHFGGCVHYWDSFHIDVVFLIYSMNRPNFFFTASKSNLKLLR